jgi:hypothetical protein
LHKAKWGESSQYKRKEDIEKITAWFYMGSTTHRGGMKRNNKSCAHGRRKGRDTRNTHGGIN